MKVLSIVALSTPDGSYGGPTRVAVNQAAELQRQGHAVTIAAGARGYGGTLPTRLGGVPARLFPARALVPRSGFAGLSAPALLRALPRLAASVDIVHVHAARDLLTLPAAAWLMRRRIPYVLQTHGMIDPSGNPLSRPLDALLTRRVLRAARCVFYLTPAEKDGLIAVAGSELRLAQLGNGVPIPACASDSSRGTEVLFLARLAERKRPEIFVQLAKRLSPEFPDTAFRLVGPDEGEGESVRRSIRTAAVGVDVAWEGPIAPEAAPERMRRAALYVLPAVDEPYPMSVLEAMAMGIPVVITDSCGLAPLVRMTGCGVVVGPSLEALTSAVRDLLAEPSRRAELGRRGRETARRRLGMPAVAHQLVTAYAG